MSKLQIEKYQAPWRPVVEGGEMPPNETPVLAVIRSDENHRNRRCVVRAKYVRQHSVNCSDMDFDGDPDYCEAEDEYYWPKGWYEWNESEETHWMIGNTVTHWAPLPDMPAR